MSGRGRLAVCAAVATLTAACALLPLVDPATWLLQASLLVAVQTAVGAAGRRVPLARPLTLLAQAAVSLILLTAIFARPEALAGILPTPEAFTRFGDLLQQGSDDIGHFTIPAPVTDGIRLMLVGGVLLIGLTVDALAVTYRSAAPAGLPLLALYSVAAGLSEGGARWLWFLCAGAGYLLLLLAEGRERLSQWGRVFAPQVPPGYNGWSRPPGAGGTAVAPVRAGRRIGALTLGLALAVPALLPSMSGGLLDSVRNSGEGGGGGNGNGKVNAVNPLVALQDSLNQPENRTVLTYRSDSPAPEEMYLRIVALDDFDGSAWTWSEREVTGVPDPFPQPRGLSPRVRTSEVNTTVAAADWYAQRWLPMPFPASRVDTDGRWRFEPESRTLLGDRGQTTRGARYQVTSLLVQPTAEQLRRAAPAPPSLVEEYTRVPSSLPRVVSDEARRLTRNADNDYERAMALQQWFTEDGDFIYDTEVQSGSGSAAIANFLEQREGFCIHFAFSMAAMSRTLDIPARVAVGFTPGTEDSEGRTTVGLQDAHAWPELYFEGIGWTRFEPTPSRGTPPPYAVDQDDDTVGDPEGDAPPLPQESDRPLPEPSASAECTVAEKRSDPQCGAAEAAPGQGSSGGGPPWGRLLLLGTTSLLLLTALLTPLLWRVRLRARRLGTPDGNATALTRPPSKAGPPGPAPPGGPEPPEATAKVRHTVLSAWEELLDTGWDYGILPEESATPRQAAERLVRHGELHDDDAAAAQRTAMTVERALYAPRPDPPTDTAQDVRRVRAALRRTATRRQRVRALLLPRSSVRVIWAISNRRTRFAARWRRRLRPPFSRTARAAK